MTIKVGTLCIIVYAHENWKGRWNGRICTITSNVGGLCKARLQRPEGSYKTASGSERCFFPLNDPDNAPADPAYTKRRTHA